ncbi:hypothetical protein [Leptolyngbya sp. FACHB-711]|uniref:hypothetical protein n=1 Tax=Leptolyngbya sp. FACHB-711 TaxID=2692813 RepID=UPI001F55440B|nr:hypothetical protein [Leptolyngbya sp. FACHB-711]
MSIGIGLAINQSLAVCDGLLNVGADFVRTPKHGVVNRKQSLSGKRYRSGKTWVVCLESLMLAYLAVTLAFAVQHAHYWSIPFLAMFCIGYLYVMGLSLYQNR